jgi:hypothetical protein
MAETKKDPKEPKYVEASGKLYPSRPGVMDHLKEGFEQTATRADLDAMRRRHAKLYGPSGN